MNNKTCRTILSLLLLLIGCSFANAQTFTRITSPLNPIVTDVDRSGGASWVDIDNDGDLDLFVSNGNLLGQNNALYINTGGGAFSKVVTGDIITDGGSSIGSTWGDYDNDGFLDCFVTNRNFFGNFLYHGNGTANPVKQTGIGPVTDIANSNSSSWVDIDNDGDLDLYTVNFQGSDYLYLNSGGSFSANQSTPLQADGSNFSIAGLWADYNNDRRPDLFVGNAGAQNDSLYTNNGGLNFTVTTLPDGMASLGGSWGDYDNDGDLDLFITNYGNQACILYNNSGAPNYILTPVASSPVQVVGNNVGSAFGDIDNDGDLDLVTADDGGNEHLFLNTGYPGYTFIADSTGQIANGGNSFACALGDYDNDGSLDIVVANLRGQNNFLYHNNGNANSWVTIKCVGMQSNKAGIGTKVFVKATIGGQPIWQMREVAAQTGYNAQNLWLHFGFGSASLIDTMIIKWPSGRTDTCINIPTNSFYTRIEGVSCVLCNTAPTVVVTSSTDASYCVCPVIPTGSITLAITGKGPFTYSLNGGAWTSFTIPGTITGLTPLMSYTVRVKDACDNIALAPGSVYINQKMKLVHYTGSAKNPSNIICVDAPAVAAHVAHHSKYNNPAQHDYVIDPCYTGGAARLGIGSNGDIRVIPNPNKGIFRILLPAMEAAGSLIITDVQGKIVRKTAIMTDETAVDINISDLASGIYFIRLTDGEHVYKTKLVTE